MRQEDIFLPNITVQETLEYAGALRLGLLIDTKTSRVIVEKIINGLRLQLCAKPE